MTPTPERPTGTEPEWPWAEDELPHVTTKEWMKEYAALKAKYDMALKLLDDPDQLRDRLDLLEGNYGYS